MGATERWEYEAVSGWLPIPGAASELEAKAWFRKRFNVGKVRRGQIRKVAA